MTGARKSLTAHLNWLIVMAMDPSMKRKYYPYWRRSTSKHMDKRLSKSVTISSKVLDKGVAATVLPRTSSLQGYSLFNRMLRGNAKLLVLQEALAFKCSAHHRW